MVGDEEDTVGRGVDLEKYKEVGHKVNMEAEIRLEFRKRDRVVVQNSSAVVGIQMAVAVEEVFGLDEARASSHLVDKVDQDHWAKDQVGQQVMTAA